MAMTNEGGYLPCLNPNCKSHGKSHPNCQCYAGHAEGGEVQGFCAQARAHDSGCEYFAEGGEVPTGDLPQAPTAAQEAPETPTIAQGEVPATDMPQAEVPANDLPGGDHSSLGQQAGTLAEGVSQGIAGPAAPFLETHPTIAGMIGGPATKAALEMIGTTPEDIAARQEANPELHAIGEGAGLIGSLATGTGEASLLAKGTKALTPEATTLLGKVGAGAIRGAIEGGLFRGGDEITDALLGKGDPAAPVSSALANMGAAAVFGGMTGGLFGGVGGGIEKLAESKLAPKLNSFMAGLGAANQASKVSEVSSELGKVLELDGDKWFQRGVEFHEKIPDLILEATIDPAVYKIAGGGRAGAEVATAVHNWVTPKIEKLLGASFPQAVSKYVVPAALKALGGGASPAEVLSTVGYAVKVARGAQRINKAVENVFKSGGNEAAPIATDFAKRQIKESIENNDLQKSIEAEAAQQNNGQAPQEGFATGGEIKAEAPQPVSQGSEYLAKHYPEQNILLQQARGRISGYLQSIKPNSHPQSLPFDRKPTGRLEHQAYDQALGVAAAPLSVLNHIQKGSLTPDHVRHIQSMYPEIYQELSQKLTHEVSTLQSKGLAVPYKTRIGLSLFLGAPLDSTMTPDGIATIQGLYAQGRAQQQAQGAGLGKSTANSMAKLAQNSQTSGQALASRQLRAK